MKTFSACLTLSGLLCLASTPALADSALAGNPCAFMTPVASSLFGSNVTFTAGVQVQYTLSGNAGSLFGKLASDKNKSRFEIDTNQPQTSLIPQSILSQTKDLGLEQSVCIVRLDKNQFWTLYPSQQAYVVTTMKDSTGSTNALKVSSTSAGTETVNGHACAKNTVVVTDSKNRQHTATVWNATDLQNFPIKIQMFDTSMPVTLSFTNVSFTAPATNSFEIPSDYTKCDNVQGLAKKVLAKKASNTLGNALGGFLGH
jgi:hypothetical protein